MNKLIRTYTSIMEMAGLVMVSFYLTEERQDMVDI